MLIDVVYVSQVGHATMRVQKHMQAVRRSRCCCTCGCQSIYAVIDRDTQRLIKIIIHNVCTEMCICYTICVLIRSQIVMVSYTRWQNLFPMLVNQFKCAQLCHEKWAAVYPSMYNRVILKYYVCIIITSHNLFTGLCVWYIHYNILHQIHFEYAQLQYNTSYYRIIDYAIDRCATRSEPLSRTVRRTQNHEGSSLRDTRRSIKRHQIYSFYVR